MQLVVLASVATYSISQLLEILSPIPTVWLTCNHDVDVAQMHGELTCNDVVILSPIPTVWLTCDHDADAAQMRGELPHNDVVV
uniref:Uncharacterized protein n=1 Tax=Oryza nivara TaxID=4536 RepID=A0A0E0HI24_ORYNI